MFDIDDIDVQAIGWQLHSVTAPLGFYGIGGVDVSVVAYCVVFVYL